MIADQFHKRLWFESLFPTALTFDRFFLCEKCETCKELVTLCSQSKFKFKGNKFSTIIENCFQKGLKDSFITNFLDIYCETINLLLAIENRCV